MTKYKFTSIAPANHILTFHFKGLFARRKAINYSDKLIEMGIPHMISLRTLFGKEYAHFVEKVNKTDWGIKILMPIGHEEHEGDHEHYDLIVSPHALWEFKEGKWSKYVQAGQR